MEHHGHNDHHDHEMFHKGDRISYMGKEGVVSRTNILGFRPCCALEVQWDDGSLKTILKMGELKHVSKL